MGSTAFRFRLVTLSSTVAVYSVFVELNVGDRVTARPSWLVTSSASRLAFRFTCST